MPSRTKTSPANPRWNSDVLLLTWLATCVSVLSFLFIFQRGYVLLYGDAIAHINIARRVFDSKTPGLLQLGTVWLPLPHLLMIPFVISENLWQRGAGSSIPSMAAYVFGVVGMFRLVRGVLSRQVLSRQVLSRGVLPGSVEPDIAARVAAWLAAIVYAANPNLMYLQATAMGEALYLALFIWSVLYLSEFFSGDANALTRCALCLAAACLTRYDAWFVAAAMIAIVVGQYFLKTPKNAPAEPRPRPSSVAKFVLIAAAAPALWLTYNAIVYRNPLEFENGPYSAKAIERKTESESHSGHPGNGNPLVAGMYFVKSAEMNVANNVWLQRLWILLVLVAVIATKVSRWVKATLQPRAAFTALLVLLLPLPFYILSVAYGGVPIFVPAWWPYSYYNVRYGLQLLPAFAFVMGVIVFIVLRWGINAAQTALTKNELAKNELARNKDTKNEIAKNEIAKHRVPQNDVLRLACVVAVFAFVLVSYASIWRPGPATLQEARINMRARNQLERNLADWLKRIPPDATLLMYLGDHVGALQQAGIPLRRVINEGNHRVWVQPSDPDGLWERALANPAGYADFAIGFEGDPVWQSAKSKNLPEVVEIHVAGQAGAVVYRAR
jgi:hypothetical protein